MKLFSQLFSLLVLFLLPTLAFGLETDFVPLTNIPVLFDTGNSINTPEGLSVFLNNIYKVCIGVAAVIAVLQIMRAGIMYMGGDSVTEKKDAKNLIAMSIGGLILVLSPVVVFSIINPEILTLKISGIDALEVKDRPLDVTPTPGGGGVTGDGTGNEEDPAEEDPVTRVANAGQFWGKLVTTDEAAVTAFRADCNTDKILETAKNLVERRHLFEARETLDANNRAVKTLYCESYGQKFFVYQLKKKEGGAEGRVFFVPGEEQKSRAYKQGCQTDGGAYQGPRYGAWSAWGVCNMLFDGGTNVEERVFNALASTGIKKEEYSLRCRAERPRCIKY
ncbi:pilin [Patescibacteria group bacterium]|nr:pilin [Patescibacteria group bacterium]MBU1500622.1 pilin [Patescibacteria group bacterium]MBU2080535.1 pilin [Patescibacteria group bacterium]MBU2123660.1 pilin [Patescibacteria group bacterium]MBU2194516.1 pilin [Patescibacteria group bacterium]